MWGSCDPLLEFWTRLISRERVKLETSNMERRWTAVSTNEKMRDSKTGKPIDTKFSALLRTNNAAS